MSDRRVTFTGIEFENPFLLSSAPPTESENNILRAFDAGWGGVVCKTIGLHPVVNVVGAKTKFLRTSAEDSHVSMAKRPGAALHSSWNWELISDKPLDWWIPRIRRIKEAFPSRVLEGPDAADAREDLVGERLRELRDFCERQRQDRRTAEAARRHEAIDVDLELECFRIEERDRRRNFCAPTPTHRVSR